MNAQLLTTAKWQKARELNIQQFMSRELRPDRNIAIGGRLKLARMAFGMGGKGQQGKFAAQAGIGSTVYNQWETGENFVGIDNAMKLCQRYPGLTLDWIYLAKMEGLPTWLASALHELQAGQVIADKPPQPPQEPVQPAPAAKVVHLKSVRKPKRRRHSA